MTPTPFQQILGTMDEAEFFDTYWQKRSLVIKNRETPWPFTFNQDLFFQSIEGCDNLKMAFQNAEGQHKECEIQPEQARRLYEAGTTICATRIDYGNPTLRRFLNRMEQFLVGGEFHMNSYLSPGGKGFGIHYDYHSVWVLQIEGTKRWFYAEEPVVRYPILNLVYPLNREEFTFPWYTIPRPDDAQLKEVVLEPGDLLYLPAGAWHKTQAGGYSLSITMGHEPVQASRYLNDLIMAGIWKHEMSRAHLPPILTSGDSTAASEEALHEIFSEALTQLQTVVGRIKPEQLVAAWKAQADIDQRRRRKATPAATKRPNAHGSNPIMEALKARVR